MSPSDPSPLAPDPNDQGRRRVGRPSATEADDLRRDILAAALLEFRTNGFAGASIERIAAAARVTRSAIYRRYVDKRTLFLNVLERQIGVLRALADEVIVASENPLSALRGTAQAYARYVVSPVAIDLQRIVISEVVAGDASAPLMAPVPDDLSNQVEALVIAAQQAGQLRAGSSAAMREALMRLVAEGPRWQVMAGDSPWSEERLRADFDRMWPLFLQMAGA